MVSIETFKQMALAFDGAEEKPHFERTAFRTKKGIFATLDEKNARACLLFSEVEQSVFCEFDSSIIYPVPNKWGKKGATYIELKKVPKAMCKDALNVAYQCLVNERKR